jgi:hypothetical protein
MRKDNDDIAGIDAAITDDGVYEPSGPRTGLGGLPALQVTGTQFRVSSRRRLPGAFRRLCADRRDYAGIHQPASCAAIR